MNGLASEQGQRLCRIGFGCRRLRVRFVVYLPFSGAAVALLAGRPVAPCRSWCSLPSRGAGFLSQAAWAYKLARAASWVALVIGLLLVTTLALTASYPLGSTAPWPRRLVDPRLSRHWPFPNLVSLAGGAARLARTRRVVAKRESVSTEPNAVAMLRPILRFLAAYLFLVAVACAIFVHREFSLHLIEGDAIASV